MIIADVLKCHIEPFEIEDDALKRLFSYYLHLAPTINSASSRDISDELIKSVWDDFVLKAELSAKQFHVYSPGFIKEGQLEKYELNSEAVLNRKKKGLVCCFKEGENDTLKCVLRHIRNSIAHSNVFLLDNRRKYIIFDDYNKKNHLTARILFSQTDLKTLKKMLDNNK